MELVWVLVPSCVSPTMIRNHLEMRRSNNNNKSRKPRTGQKDSRQPPQIKSNVAITHTYRFRSTAGTTTDITQDMLLGIAGGIGTTANSSVTIACSSVKVHSVKIWTPPAAQGAVATCSVLWSAIGFGQILETTDTTVSTATPAHVKAKPPLGSSAYQWQQGGSSVIMTLVAPTGSIIDVHATHIIRDVASANTTFAAAAVTLGVYYWFPLDGTGDVYLPVSLLTTT